MRLGCLAIALLPLFARAQTPDQVLVVANKKSAVSQRIARSYMTMRRVPAANLCVIDSPADEIVARPAYDAAIEKPIAAFLTRHGLREKILYIVLTKGVPLRIAPTKDASTVNSDEASVDSELTLLYRRMKGAAIPFAGPVPNPFFRQRDTPFRHPLFPIYLVTRLDGYTVEDILGVISRAPLARNQGRIVIDLRADDSTPGNQWLRTAALLLPKERVVIDESAAVLSGIRDVIGYASWGSNDHEHKHRLLHFQWLPGGIATEFVSTDARTFVPPPPNWEIGTWADQHSWYAGAPQSLTGDYIHEGATGASGQVEEPFLTYCPRPDFVLPAYFSGGRNLAESFYMGIPGLSWMNVVIGDPLMRLAP